MNIISLLEKITLQYQNKDAIIDAENARRLSYQDLYLQIQKCASVILKLGISKSIKVAIYMENSIEQITIFFSLLYLGAVPVLIDKKFCNRELVQCLKLTHTNWLITDNNLNEENYLKELNNQLNVKLIFFHNSEIKYKDNIFSYEKMPNSVINKIKKSMTISSIILFTYRGLGFPLPVLFSEKALINAAHSNRHVTEMKHTVIMSFILPLTHIFGLTCNLLCPIFTGSTVVMIRNISPRNILTHIEHFKINFLLAVPSLLKILLPSIKKHNHNLRELRQGIVGGDVYSPELFNEWTEATDSLLLQGYGLTETSAVICNRWHKYRPDALGLPMKGVKAKIVDHKNNPLPINKPGRLWIKAWCMMQGYYQLKEQTASVFNQGWFDTGDIAIRDKDGFYYFTGRAKKITKVGGFTVDLTEVENIVKNHPQVQKATITIKQDPLWQQVLVCKIKTKADLTKLELIKYCRNNLAAYKVPRDFIIEKAS